MKIAGPAFGLHLNPQKTAPVFPLGFSSENLERELKNRGIKRGVFSIQRTGRHLGLMLGYESSAKSWPRPIGRYVSAVRDIKSLGLGLMKSTARHNSRAFPRL
eukprot:102471-Pyramimonas_sp.AAC.1